MARRSSSTAADPFALPDLPDPGHACTAYGPCDQPGTVKVGTEGPDGQPVYGCDRHAAEIKAATEAAGFPWVVPE